MDCKQASAYLMDYLYQELDEDEAARVAGHLRGCEQCADELAAFEATRATMRQLEQLESPPRVTAQLMQRAARSLPAEQVGWIDRLRAGLRMLVLHPAMTAAVALVLVLGISFYAYQRTAPQRSAAPAEELVAPVAVKASAPAPRRPPAARIPTEAAPSAREVAHAAAEAARPAATEGLRLSKPAARASAAPGVRARAADLAPRRVARAGKVWPQQAEAAPVLARQLGKGAAIGGADGEANKEPDLALLSNVDERKSRRGSAPAPKIADLLSQAKRASSRGQCELAFEYYARALKLDPALQKTIGASLRPCLAELANMKGGDVQLAKARRSYPGLAPWLQTESMSGKRARAAKQVSPAADQAPAAQAPAGQTPAAQPANAEPTKE